MANHSDYDATEQLYQDWTGADLSIGNLYLPSYCLQ
jgi:hypothetical protein